MAIIHYHDIGDYLSREQKLEKLKQFFSVENVPWQDIAPNEKNDWINQRDGVFDGMISIGDKDNKTNECTWFYPVYSRGLATARDAWCYCFSKKQLENQLKRSICFYNEQRELFIHEKKLNSNITAKDFVKYDATKLSWNRGMLNYCEKNKIISFIEQSIRMAIYRPFYKQNGYFNVAMNDMTYQLDKLFPTPAHKNLVICTSSIGDNHFSVIITDCVPDLHLNATTQCFPLYWYEENKSVQTTLFGKSDNDDKYIRHDGITDWILKEIRARYHVNSITKEMIFYYVYGILNSKKYRERFAPDLKKSLPRLPIVENINDFMAFSEAGRQLAQLHLYYESVPPCESVSVQIQRENYLVEKMRFPQKGQKNTIIYNGDITISNIPAEAYEYVVNGKSAIEWIMERYQITVDKDSGIRNDPNDWAREHNQPRYILDLLLSVIELSVQTVGIVNALLEVEWEK